MSGGDGEDPTQIFVPKPVQDLGRQAGGAVTDWNRWQGNIVKGAYDYLSGADYERKQKNEKDALTEAYNKQRQAQAAAVNQAAQTDRNASITAQASRDTSRAASFGGGPGGSNPSGVGPGGSADIPALATKDFLGL